MSLLLYSDMRTIKIERSEREFRGTTYSVELYSTELERQFERASDRLGDEFANDPESLERVSGDHTTALQLYGPNRIGMTHFQAGGNKFRKGYVIRAETINGEEALRLIAHIQEELNFINIKGMVEHTAAEAVGSDGKKSFAEKIHFCAPFVDQGFIVYINEI